MIKPPEDRRSPLTPQVALRVAFLGTFALAMFAIIFFRLWFLQVLSGDQYVRAATSNRVRSLAVPAPRGRILDRSGTVLVDSKSVPTVIISPPDLPVAIRSTNVTNPPAADEHVYDALAKVLSQPNPPERCSIAGIHSHPVMSTIACTVAHNWALLPYSDVEIAQDVNSAIQDYLEERQAQFPGVEVQTEWLATYPFHQLAAQVLGTVGRISCNDPKSVSNCELKQPHYKGASQNAVVGQSGLEYAYDHYLRGKDGAEQVEVDALGNFRGDKGQVAPVTGNSLRLSLDQKLEQVGLSALQQSINSNYPANSGAFVAMNPLDGEVYAMGSLPSFDPNVFTHPISTKQYTQLFGQSANYPQLNRATQSAGPTGSTFKPITATAALESGAWSADQVYDDTGRFCETGGLCRRNAGGAAYGVLDLTGAIRVSDDVFFFNLGRLLNHGTGNGGALQQWAHAFGIGQKTGVDLGGEVSGNLPSPRWRTQIDEVELACEKRHHVPAADYFQPGYGCGIADGRPWSEGDNVNLAVGQGDVQATPMQLAVVYSAFANGGTIVKPHVGLEIDAPDGSLIEKISPGAVRHLNINPSFLNTILTGLHEAAQSAGGTSDDVMGTFPKPVYAKTGTAEYSGQQDYAWYACFVPPSATSTPIVVVVTVPRGGFGAVAAAPVAREILSQWFYGNPGKFIAGSSHTL